MLNYWGRKKDFRTVHFGCALAAKSIIVGGYSLHIAYLQNKMLLNE